MTCFHRFRKPLLILLLLLTALAGAPAVTHAAPRGSGDVILQGFGWDCLWNGRPGCWFPLIGERAADIAALGATMVWLPPASRSVSSQGYMPGDYYDLGNSQNATFYGTQASLTTCLTALHANGVKAIADIVINHRCAGKQDENGLWNVFHFPSGKASWEDWAIVKEDVRFHGTGNEDTGDNYSAAPDVDHLNPRVRADITAWMKWLKSLGFDGWRYDYAKGYHPKFIAEYDAATAPRFSVGEYWTSMSYTNRMNASMAYDRADLNYDQDAHRQELCNWLKQAGPEVATFDFTTKGILQAAIHGEFWRLKDKQGKAAGLIGWMPGRAVTFIDNHDTGSKQGHWPFPPDRVTQGYVYILTHPGVPCIFWEHVYDWNLKPAISTLANIRKTYGIRSESALSIVRAENGLYAAVIDDKVAMKLGWLDWSPTGQDWALLTSGEQYAVWGKVIQRKR